MEFFLLFLFGCCWGWNLKPYVLDKYSFRTPTPTKESPFLGQRKNSDLERDNAIEIHIVPEYSCHRKQKDGCGSMMQYFPSIHGALGFLSSIANSKSTKHDSTHL